MKAYGLTHRAFSASLSLLILSGVYTLNCRDHSRSPRAEMADFIQKRSSAPELDEIGMKWCYEESTFNRHYVDRLDTYLYVLGANQFGKLWVVGIEPPRRNKVRDEIPISRQDLMKSAKSRHGVLVGCFGTMSKPIVLQAIVGSPPCWHSCLP